MKYVITGTSNGLGFQLAKKLLLESAVCGISRTQGRSSQLADSGAFTHLRFDLGDHTCDDRVDNLTSAVKTFLQNEPFSLVINAAAFYSDVERLNRFQFRRLFDVNFFSAVELINGLIDHNLRRILVVNSISGIIGQNSQAEYSASKHALMGYVRSLTLLAKMSDFDVITVNPGGIKTDLWNDYHSVDTSDFLQPEAVADLLISLLRFPQRIFIDSMPIIPPSDVGR